MTPIVETREFLYMKGEIQNLKIIKDKLEIEVSELNDFIGNRSRTIHTSRSVNKALEHKVKELEKRLSYYEK